MQLTRSEFVEYIKQNVDELSSFEVMAGCPITDDLVTFLNKPKSQFLKEEFSFYNKEGHEGMLLVPPTIASAMIELAKGRLKDEPWNRRVLLADKWGSLTMCCINSLYDGCLGAFLSEGVKDTKLYDRAIIGYIYKHCISIVLDESGMSFLKYIFLPKLLMYKDFSLDTSSLYTDKEQLRLKSNMNIVALCKKEYWKSFMKNVPLLNESGFESINKQYKQLPYLTYQFAKQRLENGREDFNMKFDVVIGNPPYNNDLYLDFVQTGYNLLKDDGVMVQITPAKCASLRNSEAFEKKFKSLLPHIKDFYFYQCENDIFAINMTCGVAFYSITKDEYSTTNVKNVSVKYKSFNHDIVALSKSCECFNINALSILDKLKEYQIFSIESISKEHKYKVYNRDVFLTSNCGGLFSTGNTLADKAFILNACTISETKQYATHKPIFSSDDYLVCESFLSWLNTRLIRYLLMLGNLGYSRVFCDSVFRFIPDPGQFDHIFTDDELYKKYNLTQDEINIIESVIKERK